MNNSESNSSNDVEINEVSPPPPRSSPDMPTMSSDQDVSHWNATGGGLDTISSQDTRPLHDYEIQQSSSSNATTSMEL